MIKDYHITEEELELIRGSMEANNNNQEQQYYQNHNNDVVVYNNNGSDVGGRLCLKMKVMTDEQIELLRKQISVYATICDQLVQMHKSISAQQDITSAAGLGSLYYDSLMTYGGSKITTRHRWTPTSVQLQKLERVFDEGVGTPSKQKIKDLTAELSQHGQISETNVYNWFQNRRARSKRKQFAAAPNNSEADVEEESEPSEKNTRPADISNLRDNTAPRAKDAYMHDPASHCLGTQRSNGKSSFPSAHNINSYGSYGSS